MEKKYRHPIIQWVAEWSDEYKAYLANDGKQTWFLPKELIEGAWELQPEPKEYTVLAYRDKGEILHYVEKRNRYETDGGWGVLTPDYAQQQNIEIYSIRREGDTDKPVFTIGDNYGHMVNAVLGVMKVGKIVIENGEVYLVQNNASFRTLLSNAYKVEPQDDESVHAVENKVKITIGDKSWAISKDQASWMSGYLIAADVLDPEEYQQKKDAEPVVIMTTADRVDVCDPDQMLYWVDEGWRIQRKSAKNAKKKQIRPYWAHEEDAKEYIEYHKPCLSQKEIMEEVEKRAVQRYNDQDMGTMTEYRDVFKSELNNYVIEKMSKK